jgi:uncharacterized protein (DUF924 family)
VAHSHEILEFWFGTLDPTQISYARGRKTWFGKNAAFDNTIRQRFLATYQQAINHQLDDWAETPSGALALVLVLDQFPRNMFRHTPQAFASDAQAQQVAKGAIARGFDQALHPVQRSFMYLPLEHSEALADQQQSVELFSTLSAHHAELLETLDYAQRHRAVIEKFGRFPHRNAILGRDSTVAELEFLKQPGSSF